MTEGSYRAPDWNLLFGCQPMNFVTHSWLRQHSHLYIFCLNSVELRKIRAGAYTQHFLSNIMRSNSESPAWRVTGEVLAETAGIAAEYDTPVMYVLLPPPHYIDENMSYRPDGLGATR